MSIKICYICKKEKEIKEFSKCKTKKDGYNGTCKECHSVYRKEHYQKNKEKVSKQVRQYKKENPEKYIKKYANTKPNYKAGRTIKSKCDNPNCDINVYWSLEDIKNQKKKYCSKECQYKDVSPFTRFLGDCKKRAKQKNIEFNIDVKYIENLFNLQNGRCALSGVPLIFSKVTKIYETPSLDRIENSKGYIEGNIQWVILGINYMKLRFSDEDLHKTLQLIVENYKH